MFKHVINEELELTLVDPRHADEYFALIDANRERLAEWFPRVEKSVDDVRKYIRDARNWFAESGDVVAGVWHRDEMAGCVELVDVDTAAKTAEMGYWLGEDYEGKGLVTMACRALLDYAFKDLGMQRVQIRVATDNERSTAVPKRLGFHYEGTLRRAGRQGDRFEDVEVYSMLRGEWTG